MIAYTKDELAEMIKNDEDINDKKVMLTLQELKELIRSVSAKTMNSPTAWSEKPYSNKWNSEVDMYAAKILDSMILMDKIKVVKELMLDS